MTLLDWDYLCARYKLADRVRGIVHCGAHLAEEAGDYAKIDVPVWWVEGNPRLAPEIDRVLADYPNQTLLVALLSDRSGVRTTLNISGPGYRGSSSILEWGTHKEFSPLGTVDTVVLPSTTLDDLWRAHGGFPGVNMLVTDLQGADGMVMRAGMRLIEQVNWIMCEVNTADVYVGCMQLPELDAMLAAVNPGPGFERVETHMVVDARGEQGWGDCLYRREGQQWSKS